MNESFADLVARQEAAKRAEEEQKRKPSQREVELRAALSNPEGHPLSFLLDDREAHLATEFLKYMKGRFSPHKKNLSMTGEIETQGFVDRLLGRTALRRCAIFSTYGFEIGIAARRPGLLKMSDYVPKQFQPDINAFGRPFSNHKNAEGTIDLRPNTFEPDSINNILPVFLCTDGRLRTKNAGTLPATFKNFYPGGVAGRNEYDTDGQYARQTGRHEDFIRLPLEDVLLILATS